MPRFPVPRFPVPRFQSPRRILYDVVGEEARYSADTMSYRTATGDTNPSDAAAGEIGGIINNSVVGLNCLIVLKFDI